MAGLPSAGFRLPVDRATSEIKRSAAIKSAEVSEVFDYVAEYLAIEKSFLVYLKRLAV